MISLSERQKNDIGLRFVLDKLNTCTPYGAELVSKLTPFMPNEKERLILELDDVGRVKNGYNDLRLEIIGIFHTMSLFKDIRPMLGKCKNDNAYVLDEVELFELKNFLLSLKELCLLFNAAQKSLFLSSQLPIDMPYALAVLDPESSDLRTFYMPDQASARLSEIRAKKRRLEAEITAADNDEQKQILREQRFAVVCHEDDEGLCIRRELTRKLLSWHDEFIQNTIVIGHLDLLLQKGRLAAENETAHPTLSDSAVEFTDLYNPLTAYYLEKRGKRFTPVSIDLRRGTTILTGANMGGKSVVLKTLTLNIILFQMGFFVFAKQASLPMFNHIHLVSEDLQSPDKGL
jgi:dsDNA-specific endonuclease/ATPase MutS2